MFSPSELQAARKALRLACERCSLDATYRAHPDLQAALNAVRAVLDGENRTDALASARRAQAIVDELGTPPYTPHAAPTARGDTPPPGLRVAVGTATPQYVVAKLVRTLERLGS
jgi:hypothetical protein